MNDSTGRTDPRPGTEPCPQGWRIERIPGRPLRTAGNDRMALPLWLVRDGRHVADVELVMSLAEAEHLHAALCLALDGHEAPAGAPYCRQPFRPSRGIV